MNGLLLGEKYARTLGSAVAKIRVRGFAITGVLIGAVTAYSGPGEFLGLVVAQLARGLFRTSDHRILILGSVLLGAAVAIVMDLITHLPWSKLVLHLNAVNGLIGASVVIWIILRHWSSRSVEIIKPVARIVPLAFLLATSACKQIESPPVSTRVMEHLASAPTQNFTHACPDTYNTHWDYFPAKTVFTYSQQLRITYFANYKVVDFIPNISPKVPLRYVLYQCGTLRPTGFNNAIVIEVPVQRAVLNDPTFGESADRLGLLDRFYGVNDLDAFSNSHIIEAGEQGRIHQLGTRGPSSIEIATAIYPDVVFLFYSANPTFHLHPALRSLGVGAVAMADLFESSELGRADWFKFLALFFNEERAADTYFRQVAARYEELAEIVKRNVTERPGVLLGFASSRESWTAPGGQNALAQLVRDAGGTYVFESNSVPAVNVPMPYERAVKLGAGARFWIGTNGLNRMSSKRSLTSRTPQLAYQDAVRKGRVFALDSHVRGSSPTPFTDSNLDRPDVLLKDFVWILHPELIPGYRPVFAREIL